MENVMIGLGNRRLYRSELACHDNWARLDRDKDVLQGFVTSARLSPIVRLQTAGNCLYRSPEAAALGQPSGGKLQCD